MSKWLIVLIIVLCGAAGFGGGFVYDLTLGKETTNTKTETSTVATETQTQAECLTEVWGADKYAAITANPNLATDDDNLAALKCYK